MDELTNYRGPGFYRHFKGGLYEVLGTAVREESIGLANGEIVDVVYRPVEPYDREEQFVTRPLKSFNEQVPEQRRPGVSTTGGPLPRPEETHRAMRPRFRMLTNLEHEMLWLLKRAKDSQNDAWLMLSEVENKMLYADHEYPKFVRELVQRIRLPIGDTSGVTDLVELVEFIERSR